MVHTKRYGFKEGWAKNMVFMELALKINIKCTDSIHDAAKYSTRKPKISLKLL